MIDTRGRIEEIASSRRDLAEMAGRLFGQTLEALTVEADTIEARLGGFFLVGAEVNPLVLFIHQADAGHLPGALGQPGFELSLEVVIVQVPPAVDIAAQQEPASVLYEIEVLEKLDPGGLLLVEDLLFSSGLGIDAEDLDVVLAAVHPLDGQPVTRRKPERPGHVEGGLLVELGADT